MDISSPGQVSSLTPEATRPNAPVKPQPAEAVATASVGGTPQNAPSKVVADTNADSGLAREGTHGAPDQAVDSIDITV